MTVSREPVGMGGAWSENGKTVSVTFGDFKRAREALAGTPTK